MAVVNLGTSTVDIGGVPVTYTPFAFRDNRAYLIEARCTIERPNLIFSRFQVRGIFTNSAYSMTYTHHLIDLPLSERNQVFLLPFSNLYDGNGTVTLEVERLPIVRGGGDDTGQVDLQLLYDDSADVRTWL